MAKSQESVVIMGKSKEVKDVQTKVMLLGLASGEQVVGKVSEDLWSDAYVEIKNPAILVSAEKGLGMAPWLLYSNAEKDGVQVNKSNIVFAVSPRNEIVSQYNVQYGNGLILPTMELQAPPPELTLAV